MAALNSRQAFEALCRRAEKTKWVVFAKAPFGGPEHVLKYLAAIPIGSRQPAAEPSRSKDGNVTFLWKDYVNGNKTKVITPAAVEFIRRFLHTLPAGERMRHHTSPRSPGAHWLRASFAFIPGIAQHSSIPASEARNTFKTHRLRPAQFNAILSAPLRRVSL
jgi:hypothetical protein